MAEKELDFAPSPLLAALSGLGKGISDEVKRRKEAEAKRIQSESALFRQLFPVFFQEQGRERRFGQEQAWEREKFVATTRLESIRDEIDQMRWEIERGDKMDEARWNRMVKELEMERAESARLHDELMDLRNFEQRKVEFGLEREKFQEAGQQFMQTFGLAKERETRGAAEFAKTFGLDKIREERGAEEFKVTTGLRREEADIAAERKVTEDAIRLRDNWSRRRDAFLYSYIWSEFQADPTDDQKANAAKAALDALNKERMRIPTDIRPSIEEMPHIYETGEKKRMWFDSLERGTMPVAPDGTQRVWPKPIKELKDTPISAAKILQKYNIGDKDNNLARIKKLTGNAKAEAWQPIYRALRDSGVSEEDIAIIEKELGIK